MQTIEGALGLVIGELSDQNYAQSLDFYRFWLDTGQTYVQIPPDQICDAIWNNRVAGSINRACGQFIHPTAHLIPRFASDVESDRILATHCSELQSRLCARSLREFFSNNLMVARYGDPVRDFYADANLVARWANLGYVEEVAIRDHILQSLIAHPELYDHQVDALIILFKLAGATFGAYADPSVVDRCFELLKGHSYTLPYPSYGPGHQYNTDYVDPRRELVRVSASYVTKYGHWAKETLQEVIALRERGWEGLPPPPIFARGKPRSTAANQNDPAATPVVTSLGLPNRDLEPQISQPSPPEPSTAVETDTIHEAPVIQSPSISISTLSDFTVADASDDESPTSPTFADTSDDEPLVDPAAAVFPHETFYLDDGNVEVLCGNTIFRVHVSTLSFHSPALRRMFAQANLASAESPNGCPRIPSSDTAKDFATLLKMIYLPGFVILSECFEIIPLTVSQIP